MQHPSRPAALAALTLGVLARLPRRPRIRPVLAPDETRDEISTVPRGIELARIYFAGGRYPAAWNRFRRYGPTSARFDHHLAPAGSGEDRGILYAASDLSTAVSEAFQAEGLIDVVNDDPYLAILRVARPVRLLSLRSDWPTRAGASQALTSGIHASARLWSGAIYEDLGDIEGIEFDSSMHRGGINYALYERAEDAFEMSPVVNIPLGHRGLRPVLRNIAADLNYGLVLPVAGRRTPG